MENRKIVKIDKNTKLKDLPKAGIILKSGNSEEFKTGDWKNRRPIHNSEKCKNCLLCVPCCPENCIKQKDGKLVGIDYDYCKGCGVCSKVCPFGAIEMKND